MSKDFHCARSQGLFLLALLVGCGSAELTSTGKLHSDSTLADPDATCTSQALSDSNPDPLHRVCAGEWLFSQYSPCPIQSRWCGVDHYEQVQCPNTCTNPAFGVAYYTTVNSSTWLTGQKDCITVCDIGRCHQECDCNYGGDCPQAGQDALNATVISGYRGGVTVTTSVGSDDMNRCKEQCLITLSNVPVFNSGTDPICGTYTCDGPPVYNTCVVYGLSPYACLPGTPNQLTPFGQSLADVEANDHPSSEQTPVCLTGDPLPLDDPDPVHMQQNARALFDRLLQTQAMTTPPPPQQLIDLVNYKMKLLFELDAALLSTDQLAKAVSLYNLPTGECGPTSSIPAPPQSDCINPAGTFQLCAHLSANHVSLAAIAPFFDQCVGLLDATRQVPSDPQCASYQASLATLARTTVKQLLDHALGRMTPSDLDPALRMLNSWYGALARTFYAQGPRDALWLEVSQELKTFWSALEAPVLTSASSIATQPAGTTTAQLEALLDGASAQALAVDRAVLLAAFPAPSSNVTPPLNGAPLLYLLADGLHNVRSRLDDVSPLHDLGCRFGNFCSPSATTEARQLWHLIASLPDGAALAAALNDAVAVRDWKQVFQQISANHATLEMAANDALDPNAVGTAGVLALVTNGQGTLTAPMEPLAAVVQAAADRDRTFAATGLFDGTLRNVIDQGIEEADVSNFINRSKQFETVFAQQLRDFESNLQTLAGNVVNAVRQTGGQDALQSRVQEKESQLLQLSTDLHGLRKAADAQEYKLGQFGASFKALLDSKALDPNYQIAPNDQTAPIVVNASDARYQPIEGRDDVLVNAYRQGGSVWTMSVKQGELLNLSVSGMWSPTCAIQQRPFNSPIKWMVDGSFVDVTGARTGPEGFTYQVTSSSIQIESYSQSNQELSFQGQKQTDTGGCAGLSWSDGASVSTGWCYTTDWGHTSTQSTDYANSSSSNAKSDYSFNEGLRLENTPFPDLPAGSLVLVEIPSGLPALAKNIHRAHVLMPQTTLTFDQPVALYLVVNDLGQAGSGNACIPATGALTVTASHIVPQGKLIAQMGGAIAQTLADIENSFPLYLAQGHVSAHDLAAVEADAQQQLAKNCGCNAAAFEAPLLGFFNAWITAETAQLARFGELIENKRNQQIAQIELADLRGELANARAQTRLLALTPAWTLRNLGSEQLHDQTAAMVKFMSERLWAVAHLRYSQTFSQIAGAPGALDALQQLANAPFDSSYVQLAHIADQAALNINQQFDLNGPTRHLSYPRVSVRFPKPGATVTAGSQESLFHAVDSLRAQAVWDAIAANQPAPFRIALDDLYSLDGGAQRLYCRDALPAIHAMTVFVVLPRSSATAADQYNQSGLHLPLYIAPNLVYPSAVGPEDYQIGPSVQNYGLRVLFAGDDAVMAKLDALESLPAEAATLKVADGLSPFGLFQVDLNAVNAAFPPGGTIPNPLTLAEELLVVFELETQDQSLASWLQTCAQPGQ